MARAHAILSASGAHRWLNCPPSAQLEAKVPDTGSVYAAEGTLAHSLASLWLESALELREPADIACILEDLKKDELYSSEMPDYVEQYGSYVLEALAEAKSRTVDPLVFVEQRVDFSRWVPGGFGTGDCIIIADGVLEIIDFKYGQGVPVSADHNPQMMLYALGALHGFGFLYDIQTVRMTVFQPRIDNISSWEVPADELLAWAENELKPKAQLAGAGEGEPAPGDWCRFCKVKARCKARAEAMQSIATEFGLKDPNLLDADEIAKLLSKLDEIQSWASDIQTYALEQARDHGVRFDGWKLVEGRSNRRYTDPEAVEEILRSKRYRKKDIFEEPKLLGITAMEKLLGKKQFCELLEEPGLVIKPPGKPALVPDSDPRPELNSVEADFEFDV